MCAEDVIKETVYDLNMQMIHFDLSPMHQRRADKYWEMLMKKRGVVFGREDTTRNSSSSS